VIIVKNSTGHLRKPRVTEFSVIEAVIEKEDLSDELLLWVKELHSQ